MVEAMFERTPEFFRQFQKKFHYFICRSEPIFDTKEINNSFAYSLHENNSFCRIKEQHYHVIAALDQVTEAFKKNSSKPYSIPCLYTCFRLLLHKTQSINITFHGEIFEKLQQAVIYNHQHQLDLYSSKRKLPNIFELETVNENVQVQTDFIPTCTFNRFLSIYQNSSYAEFSKIIDIIISGYGSLNVDNENVKCNFRFELKN